MEILLTLFLCGDVMTGRGVDQAFAESVDPTLHEPAVRDAGQYLELIEAVAGPIDEPIAPRRVWGEALDVLAARSPAAAVINVETAVTTSDERWRGKGIHYRMHPANVGVLELASTGTPGRGPRVAAGLANNHVMDWGRAGLLETLSVLDSSPVLHGVGAGRDAAAARAPAVFDLAGGRRLLVFAYASLTSGAPAAWAADDHEPGVNLLPDYDDATLDRAAQHIQHHRRPGDLVVFSVHWGGNWGYDVPQRQQRFARGLIERGGVDLVHGHSAHHVKGLELHRGKLILHGLGDLITDYQGIAGHEAFQPHLSLMAFPTLNPDGTLARLELVPMRLDALSLARAGRDDARRLRDTLAEHSRHAGIELTDDGTIRVTGQPQQQDASRSRD